MCQFKFNLREDGKIVLATAAHPSLSIEDRHMQRERRPFDWNCFEMWLCREESGGGFDKFEAAGRRQVKWIFQIQLIVHMYVCVCDSVPNISFSIQLCLLVCVKKNMLWNSLLAILKCFLRQLSVLPPGLFIRCCQPKWKTATTNHRHRFCKQSTNMKRIYRYMASTRALKYHCVDWMTINTYQAKCILDMLFNLQILRAVFPKSFPSPPPLPPPTLQNDEPIGILSSSPPALNRYHCFQCHSTVMIPITLLFAFAVFFGSSGRHFCAKGGRNYKVNIVCVVPMAGMVCILWRCLSVFRLDSSHGWREHGWGPTYFGGQLCCVCVCIRAEHTLLAILNRDFYWLSFFVCRHCRHFTWNGTKFLPVLRRCLLDPFRSL